MRVGRHTLGPLEAVIIVLGVSVAILTVSSGNLLATVGVLLIGLFLLFFTMSQVNASAGTTDPETVEQWMDLADRAGDRNRDQGDNDENPVETLRERYARGEIDDHEFERGVERLVATEEIPAYALEDIDATQDQETGTASTDRGEGEHNGDMPPVSEAENRFETDQS